VKAKNKPQNQKYVQIIVGIVVISLIFFTWSSLRANAQDATPTPRSGMMGGMGMMDMNDMGAMMGMMTACQDMMNAMDANEGMNDE